MSIVRIFFNPLDGADVKEFPVAPGTLIIDFLQEHYPTGFDGFVRVFAGVEEVSLEDLDREVAEEELITILIMPGDPGTALGVTLISSLISVAVGLVINLIFPPTSPKGAKNETESPVYSLNASRNQARLGDPVSSHYGTVSFPPDYASQPTVWYTGTSNNMFVDELLCLGHGEFDIDQIFIGDTPISAIEPGSVTVWKFGPKEHRQKMGVIRDTISNETLDTPLQHIFHENWITSPEVENFVFAADRSEEVISPIGFSGVGYATAYDPVKRLEVIGHIAKVPNTLDIRAGDTITLSGTTSNNGSFLIGSVEPDSAEPTVYNTLFQTVTAAIGFNDEDPLTGTYTMNTAADTMIAGPYRAQKPGQEVTRIDVDLIFQQGLYRVDGTSGKVKTATVDVKISVQQINDVTGDPIGLPVERIETFTDKRRQVLRHTIPMPNLPQGAYDVTVERVTPIPDDDRKHDDVTWAGLKAELAKVTTPVYGDVTLLAIRLKATNGLGSAARERVRVTATRLIEDVGDSSNPISVINDIWTNSVYGLGRPQEELDLEKLFLLAIRWAGVDGPKFNGSFDQRGTGFNAMNDVISMAGGKIVQYGGLTSVAMDEQQPVRTAVFNAGNIAKDSMQIEYSFDTTSDYDSVQIEYRDPGTFQPAFITYPEGRTMPDTFVLFGCTDKTYAEQYATYLFRVRRNRRKQVTFTTELEGLIPQIGARFGVSHPLPAWGHSGVLVSIIDTVTVMVDSYLDWSGGEKKMLLRSPTGKPSTIYTVTRGSADNIVVFPSAPNVDINDAEFKEPTSYSFGDAGEIVSDFILTKITPQDQTRVQIQGQTYTPFLYGLAPPHMRPEEEQGYQCSALDTALISQGLDTIYDLAHGQGNYDYPFATVQDGTSGWGSTVELASWSSFISGPIMLTDWTDYVSVEDMTSWSWYEDATKFEQCGNTTPIIAAVNISPNASVSGITTPTNTWSPYGGYSLNTVFTGYNGGANASIEICGRYKARWETFRVGGVPGGTASGCPAYVNLQTTVSGGEHRLDISVGAGEDGEANGSLPIGSIGGQWINLSVTVGEWYTVIDGAFEGQTNLAIWSSVKITATGKLGLIGSLEVAGWKRQNVNQQAESASLLPNTSIYDSPRIYYGPEGKDITIAALSYGATNTADHLLISDGFLRTFTDYDA